MQKYEIEKTSPVTGRVNIMEIEMDPNDYVRWKKGGSEYSGCSSLSFS